MDDEKKSDVFMAVELLQLTIYRAMLDRETAVRVLLPEIDDRNSAMLTAVTMVLGSLLATHAEDAAAYEKGVQYTARLLRDNRERFLQHVREAARHGKAAR